MIDKFINYLKGVRAETAKVMWPPHAQLRESSVIVIVLALILAVFVFSTDIILNNILKLIL